jgi:hypothetical protein
MRIADVKDSFPALKPSHDPEKRAVSSGQMTEPGPGQMTGAGRAR